MELVSGEAARNYLKKNKREIFERWVLRARAANTKLTAPESLLIANSFPVFFDRVLDVLNPDTPPPDIEADLLSAHHGINRAHSGAYSLEEVFYEYDALQAVIFECLDEHVSMPPAVYKAIAVCFLAATRVAAKAFIEELNSKKNESEILFKRLVVDAKDIAIFIISPEGIIKSWNEGARRIKQFSAEEAIGHHYRMLFREEDRRDGRPERNLKLALENGRHEEQWWRIRKDGTQWWAEAILSAIYSEDGQLLGIAKIVRDLTEKKRSDDALRSAKADADSANSLKTSFVANMSHEIRTPLGAILGFSKFLADPELNAQARAESIKVIERNGKALLRIIDDILDISKIEAGKLDIENAAVPLRVVLPEVTSLFEIKAHDKGITLDLSMDPTLPEYITTDSVRLRQILSNLLSNAVKFTTHGGVKVVASGTNEGRDVEIVVSDTGPGIADEKRSRIFSEFSQADSSITRKYGGTGLGLALSRNLARELGGDIELMQCTEGVGCTFRLVIVDRKSEETSKAQDGEVADWKHTRKQRKSYPKLKGSKILLVEDSADNRLLVQRLLAKVEAHVESAFNGAEGVVKALGGNFDLILMDTQMPVMDGVDAIAKLRNKGYSRPIISLSAHAMNEDRARSLAAGSNDYLSKPIDADELYNLLESWLAREQG